MTTVNVPPGHMGWVGVSAAAQAVTGTYTMTMGSHTYDVPDVTVRAPLAKEQQDVVLARTEPLTNPAEACDGNRTGTHFEKAGIGPAPQNGDVARIGHVGANQRVISSDLSHLRGGQLRVAQNSATDRASNWLFNEAPASVTPDGQAGWFQIVNLGATNAGCAALSATDPGKVITYPCHTYDAKGGLDNQLWRFVPDPIGGGYKMQSAEDQSAITAGQSPGDLVTSILTNPPRWIFHIQ